MSLDCIITVEGKTRPVKGFISNSDKYYGAVKAHLRRCEICDPKEALEGFLQTRIDNTYGLTSSTICRMACSYYRVFSGRIPESLFKEFIIRGMWNWEYFADNLRSLTEDDVSRAHALVIEAVKLRIKDILPKVEKVVKKQDKRNAERLFNDFSLHPFRLLKRRVSEYHSENKYKSESYRMKPWMPDDPRFRLAVSLIERSNDDIDKEEEDPDIIRFYNLQKVWFVMNM